MNQVQLKCGRCNREVRIVPASKDNAGHSSTRHSKLQCVCGTYIS